jgi:hypothetical protein
MAGRKGKGNNTAMRKKVTQPGTMIRIMNLSQNVEYCAQTGLRLPRNGMAVAYEDKTFINRSALRSYLKEHEQGAA